MVSLRERPQPAAAVEPKEKKSKAEKAPKGPSYSEMIEAAITAANDKAGISRSALKKYLLDTYQVIENAASKVNISKAIKAGTEAGKFYLPKGASGKIRMATETQGQRRGIMRPSTRVGGLKKQPARKPAAAATKRPAAKKPAAAKPAARKPTKAATTSAATSRKDKEPQVVINRSTKTASTKASAEPAAKTSGRAPRKAPAEAAPKAASAAKKRTSSATKKATKPTSSASTSSKKPASKASKPVSTTSSKPASKRAAPRRRD